MSRISVIIPLYYGQKYVDKLLSMMQMNRRHLQEKNVDVEVVFVNDCPEEKLNLRHKDEVLLHDHERNMGIHGSRVTGLGLASGEYVLMLDQDDEIADDYLLRQLECLGDADAVICNGYYRDKKVIYASEDTPLMTKDEFLSSRNRIISPGQVLLRKDSIPTEWFEQIMKQAGADDFFLWILMVAEGKKFAYNDSLLYTHVEEGDNASFCWRGMVASLEEMLCLLKKSQKLTLTELEQLENSVKKSIRKQVQYADLENKWEKLHQQGSGLYSFFETNTEPEVAVYGYGIIGKKVVDELLNQGLTIKYIVDQDKTYQNPFIPLYSPEDTVPPVEWLIVTPLFAYEQIEERMQKFPIKQVVSIEKVIEEALKKQERK